MKTVSKNIRLLRQKMGWKQHEVAALLKISIPAYSKLETGRTGININRLRQVAELFKVSIVDMFSSDVTAVYPLEIKKGGYAASFFNVKINFRLPTYFLL